MLHNYGASIETPKTAGLRKVEPFSLNVPAATAESDHVQARTFHPSDPSSKGTNTNSTAKVGSGQTLGQ